MTRCEIHIDDEKFKDVPYRLIEKLSEELGWKKRIFPPSYKEIIEPIPENEEAALREMEIDRVTISLDRGCSQELLEDRNAMTEEVWIKYGWKSD